MSDRIKVAVIGTGALGKEHARLYADLDTQAALRFTGVYDTDQTRSEQIASRYRIAAYRSFPEAADAADAYSVVTPTITHFQIARALLLGGKHVLVEKPVTSTPDQAAELVGLGREHRCILQVGHIERFNPVFQYVQSVATEPRFIEAHRLSPYPGRSTDIGVVLDLMIHDLDVVLAFVRAPVSAIDAAGVAVLSASEDIANARLRFANGCVANLTASRISPEWLRKIRVFSGGDPASYVSLDYRAQAGFIYRLAREGEANSTLLKKLIGAKSKGLKIVSEFAGRKIVREPIPIRKEEPLRLELESFVRCVRDRHAPVVTGEAGKQALELAIEITKKIGGTHL